MVAHVLLKSPLYGVIGDDLAWYGNFGIMHCFQGNANLLQSQMRSGVAILHKRQTCPPFGVRMPNMSREPSVTSITCPPRRRTWLEQGCRAAMSLAGHAPRPGLGYHARRQPYHSASVKCDAVQCDIDHIFGELGWDFVWASTSKRSRLYALLEESPRSFLRHSGHFYLGGINCLFW